MMSHHTVYLFGDLVRHQLAWLLNMLSFLNRMAYMSAWFSLGS